MSYTEQLASLTQEFEKSECRNTKQSKVEEVLKKQVSELQFKLDSACQGRKAESEMAQEALTKSSQMERSVLELNAKLKALMDENTDLKEQLYSALEQHTTKSCESETSKVSKDNQIRSLSFLFGPTIRKAYFEASNQKCYLNDSRKSDFRWVSDQNRNQNKFAYFI